MKERKRETKRRDVIKGEIIKALTKSQSHRHRSILLRISYLPGHSDHGSLLPLIAEVLMEVVAGVQNNHDIPLIQLQELALLELLSKECRLQPFEFAEGPWDELVIDGKDEATMSK